MSRITERIAVSIFVALLAVIFLAGAVDAYQYVCLDHGESYMSVTCITNHPTDGVCLYCMDDNGFSKLPNYCYELSMPTCIYSTNTCWPASTRPCTVNQVNGTQTCLSNSSWGACSAGTVTPPANLSLNETEILARLAALEQWKASAQTSITDLNARVTLLEQWKLTIQATVDSLKSWLGYTTTNTFCQVSQSCGGTSCTESWQCAAWSTCNGGLQTRTCTDTNACGTTVFKPAISQACSVACTENWQCTAWGACQPTNTQARSCTDSNACGTTLSKPAESQGCTYTEDPRIVTFRTNAATKFDYGVPGSEIILDFNDDGTLDCLKYKSFYTSYYESQPNVLAKTPEGYKVNKYRTDQAIIAYGQNYIYVLGTGCATPTTSVPTAPYSTNGREVYQ